MLSYKKDSAKLRFIENFNSRYPTESGLLRKLGWSDELFDHRFYGYMIDCSGRILNGLDFSGLSFERVYFHKSLMKRVRFDRAVLEFADLTECIIHEASLFEADLFMANLRGASFVESDLRGANMIGAKFDNTDFSRANLAKCELGATFGSAIFDEANMAVVTADYCVWKGSSLKKASLICSSFIGADLRETDLRGADFSLSVLKGANLSLALCDCGTKFDFAIYDDKTRWPDNVNLSAVGALHIEQLQLLLE